MHSNKKSFWKVSFFIAFGFLVASNMFWICCIFDRVFQPSHDVGFDYKKIIPWAKKHFPEFVHSCLLCGASNCGHSDNPWSEKKINERIAKYRMAEVNLLITNAEGQSIPNLKVTVRQVRHKFLFGCNFIPDTSDKENEHNRRFAETFNYATLPFFWSLYEGFQGKTGYKQMLKMAGWCQQQNITTKGHPLVWQLMIPDWIPHDDLDEAMRMLSLRIHREVKSFAGLIDIWDVVNEAVAAPATDLYKSSVVSQLYSEIGQINMIRKAFATAREANPYGTLIINDFVVNSSYEKIIEDCLNAGIEFDVIGIQSHMHKGIWSLGGMWDVCERFSRFNKPLHFTEMTVLSGKQMCYIDEDWFKIRDDWHTTCKGEYSQAEIVKKYYRLLFSHPAVQAITWWSFSDSASWMGAPAGLLRKDFSPKPSYYVLKKLIKEDWWTGPLKLKTDADGRVCFRGFLGNYAVKYEKGNARFLIDQPGRFDSIVTIK